MIGAAARSATPGTGEAAAVEVVGVSKQLGQVDVVQDLSFTVRPGELLGFLGPNGAGKTTTMRMILDIIRPDRGRIEVFGRPPGIERHDRVGYLPEDRGLYRDVPVLDTLTYFAALKGVPSGVARRRASERLEQLGLGGSLRKKAAELSRGMQQKVQVIATLLHEPDLLIIDEPFQGLDPVNAEMLRQLVLGERARGAAIVMSTHDMDEAERLCDRILLIDHGRRVLYGPLADVKQLFSDGAVLVRGEDIPLDWSRFTTTTTAAPYDGGVRYLLRPDASAHAFFRELAVAGVKVDRFEVATPSLSEIFVRTVEGDRRAVSIS